MRQDVVPAVFGGLPGVQALVSGDAAYTYDVVGFYSDGMPMVIGFVLFLSFLLLLVAFRSLVIPIKAILLNLLSTAAAFGLLVLVFEDGNLAGLLGFKPGPIEAFVPVFIFTILFGLSMDYHVFILTRIKEARDHGMSSNEAVARGISITAGTITSAAAIMIVVFSVFVTLELTVIKQLGFGLAVAIFLDATIVRSVLLPATMRLLGDWNWWLPRWLGWLPHVTIEGDFEDEPEPAAGAPTGRSRPPDDGSVRPARLQVRGVDDQGVRRGRPRHRPPPVAGRGVLMVAAVRPASTPDGAARRGPPAWPRPRPPRRRRAPRRPGMSQRASSEPGSATARTRRAPVSFIESREPALERRAVGDAQPGEQHDPPVADRDRGDHLRTRPPRPRRPAPRGGRRSA